MMMIKGQTSVTKAKVHTYASLWSYLLTTLCSTSWSNSSRFYLISYNSFTPFPRISITRAQQNTPGQTAPGPKKYTSALISRRFQYTRQNDKHGPSPRHLYTFLPKRDAQIFITKNKAKPLKIQIINKIQLTANSVTTLFSNHVNYPVPVTLDVTWRRPRDELDHESWRRFIIWKSKQHAHEYTSTQYITPCCQSHEQR